ncbi:hypothetical protein [Geobacter sp. DSM 9736]|uniref:hypothetical protein n=1 Tax=Geobacter sp. DSM 9736 TaxID=1277350 RepID=UPI000B6151D1|nr:hypothetical protein [Geobacter sp. DSM 9736]SNB45932.1 hypothetical protein SAMN06269301_1366 [Geobacter sp. DSM 9736]
MSNKKGNGMNLTPADIQALARAIVAEQNRQQPPDNMTFRERWDWLKEEGRKGLARERTEQKRRAADNK